MGLRLESVALGRWLQPDPAAYVDGMSLYQGFRSSPAAHVDPTGLITVIFMGASVDKNKTENDAGMATLYADLQIPNTIPGNRILARHNDISWALRVVMEAKANNPCEPIILIGHSWGGQAAIDIADALAENGAEVDLLITIDPVGSRINETERRNVKRGVNIYDANQTAPLMVGGNQAYNMTNIGVYSTHTDIDNQYATPADAKAGIESATWRIIRKELSDLAKDVKKRMTECNKK